MSKENIAPLAIPLNMPIDLVALAVKKTAIRCKLLQTEEFVTLRTSLVGEEVEGEILTVMPTKSWTFKGIHYVSGKIESSKIDVVALQLIPLALKDEYPWSPEEEYWGEPGEEIDTCFLPMIKFGPRKSYEMEQVIPFQDPEEMTDPILEASEDYGCGASEEAYKIMEKLLVADLRCLDAHAHLGNWLFDCSGDFAHFNISKAKRHYQIGVQIGELSLSPDFNGLLPWGRIDNRPFLRCLHGYGLCLWRLGQIAEAREVFGRMLWLNPCDNQGIRFILAAMNENISWEAFASNEV